jgi:hypothetical protein
MCNDALWLFISAGDGALIETGKTYGFLKSEKNDNIFTWNK